MSELKEFDVKTIPYEQRFQTIDGVRWVMLKESNRHCDYEIEFLRKQLEAAEQEIKALWTLLDNIDTAGDLYKPNKDRGYFHYVESQHRERHKGLVVSDGYELTIDYERPARTGESDPTDEVQPYNASTAQETS